MGRNIGLRGFCSMGQNDGDYDLYVSSSYASDCQSYLLSKKAAEIQKEEQALGDSWHRFENNWEENGTLRRQDPASGKVVWSQRYVGDMFASPVIDGGHLVIGAGNRIVAVDTGTGRQTWSIPTSHVVYSTPAICGANVIAADTGGKIRSIRLADGHENWNLDLKERFDASPSCAGNAIFVVSTPGKVYRINADGTTAWTMPTHDPVDSSPSLDDHTLYVVTQRGNFFALDQATGTKRWAAAISGVSMSSPVLIGSSLYVGTINGTIEEVNAATGESRSIFRAGDIVEPSIAYADGFLYFGSRDRNFYALHGEPAPSGNPASGANSVALPLIVSVLAICIALFFARSRNPASQVWSPRNRK